MNRVRSRLPGQVRVYVHVKKPFTYERWIQSLREGRTFVTDGPMFTFTVDDKMAGTTIKLDKPRSVAVSGVVESQYPLSRVEIVANGKIVHTVQPDQPSLRIEVTEEVPVDRSGWIAIRATGPAHPDQPTGGLFSHTSPVYLEVKGKPIDAAQDAAYFVTWIDRLRGDIRKRNRIPSRHQVHVESQIAKAREVFNQLLNTGN